MVSLEREFIKETGQLGRFAEWKRDRKYFKLRDNLNVRKCQTEGQKR